MVPYGNNGHWHYRDCEAKLNTDPACKCVQNMAKQIAELAEQVKYLMAGNRHLQKQINNAT